MYGLVFVFENGQNVMRVEAPNNRIEWDFENNCKADAATKQAKC